MAMMGPGLRARFTDTMLTTASPSRLLTMLFDRLCRDCTEAAAALRHGDLAGAHRELVHAQDIVVALRDALDPIAWPAARELRTLYGYVLEQLTSANLTKDAARVDTCLQILEPLRDAWHTASRTAGSAETAPAAAALAR
jgi:flagellar protein FliS